MLPYLIAGAIGFGIGKLFEEGGETFGRGGKAEKKYYWIKMDRSKIDEYIDYASRMMGMFEGEIYTQAPNKVAFDTENDMFAFTSMIDNHNNDNDFQEGDEGYIYYEELFNGEPRPNIFEKIIGNKYAGGGEAGKSMRDNYDALIGRVGIEYYFLDEIFKYKDGFKGATGTIVMPVSKQYYDYATSEEGILERYMDAMGEYEWLEVLGLDRDDFEDEDEMIKAIEDGIYDLYRVGELNPFEEVSYELEEQMRELPEFSDSDEYPLFEIIGGGRIFDKNRKFDKIYNQELFNKIKEIEEFAEGGEAGKKGKLNATYIPKRNIKTLTTTYGNTIKGKDLLDGAYTTRKDIRQDPKMVRTIFEEEEFAEFNNGGGVGKFKVGDKVTFNQDPSGRLGDNIYYGTILEINNGVAKIDHQNSNMKNVIRNVNVANLKKFAEGGEIKLRIKNVDSFDKHYDEVGFTKKELSLPKQDSNKNWFTTTNDESIAQQLISDGFVDKYAGGGEAGAESKSKIKIIENKKEGKKTATQTLVKENNKGEKITYELSAGMHTTPKENRYADGWFEIYATDENDDEYFYSEGGLWIENGRIYDYDGVYELSEKLKPLLSALNLNSEDVFSEGGEAKKRRRRAKL
jgi:hypothetical protein